MPEKEWMVLMRWGNTMYPGMVVAYGSKEDIEHRAANLIEGAVVEYVGPRPSKGE